MTTLGTDVYYDPYDIDINTDPYPTFRRLRDEAPIYYNEKYDLWALSRHADVEQGLLDWQTFSNRPERHPRHHQSRAWSCPSGGRSVRGPAAAHDAPRPDVPGLHAAAG